MYAMPRASVSKESKNCRSELEIFPAGCPANPTRKFSQRMADDASVALAAWSQTKICNHFCIAFPLLKA
jgi:hypothetical protein